MNLKQGLFEMMINSNEDLFLSFISCLCSIIFFFRLSEDREMEAIVNSLEYIDHDSFYAFTRFVDMTSSFWDEESNQNYSGFFLLLFSFF